MPYILGMEEVEFMLIDGVEVHPYTTIAIKW